MAKSSGRVCLTEWRGQRFLAENNVAGKQRQIGQPARQKAEKGGDMSDLGQRIEAMHRSDVRVAWAFVIGRWVAMIFVALATWTLAPSGMARLLLLLGGAVILVFNTAAIMAMLRHYREDREFIYGLDIKFLDEARAAKG